MSKHSLGVWVRAKRGVLVFWLLFFPSIPGVQRQHLLIFPSLIMIIIIVSS